MAQVNTTLIIIIIYTIKQHLRITKYQQIPNNQESIAITTTNRELQL